MPSTFQVPCARCGRTVTAAAARPLPVCASCAGGAASWEVRAGAERVRLDTAELRKRLLAGTLGGADVVLEGVTATPIAAHPAFRTLFLPGHPDALPLPSAKAAPPAEGAGSGLRRVLVLLGLGAVLVAAVGGAAYILPSMTEGAPSSDPATTPVAAAAAPAVEVPAEVVPPPAPPPAVDAIAELAARVGVVEEPRAALLADAWDARLLATAAGRTTAIAAAERAVVRAPEDPEALALLAELLAEADQAPELRVALLSRAKAAAPKAAAVHRALALDALARGEIAGATLHAEECLRDRSTDLGCREARARAMDAAAPTPKDAEAQNLLYALDELAKAWPENREIPRRAALLAARAEVAGAEARLAAQQKRLPDDAAILAASALLAFRNGAAQTGRSRLAKLDVVPDALLVEAAGEAVGRGAADEALRLLARVASAVPNRDARLYEAQAHWLVARSSKGSPAAAVAAGDRLAELDPGHPAVVQMRVAAATLGNDAVGAAHAWEKLQARGAPPVDLARAWIARAALDLAQQHPREALIEVDSALQADRSLPEVYLWQAAAQVAGQNGPAAVAALRAAIIHIDGRDARRRAYGGALPIPADLVAIRVGLTSLIGSDPARAEDLAVSYAVLDWLGGDLEAAAAAIAPVAERGADAEALALEARVLLAKGQAHGALGRVDQALALRPREMAWQLVRAEALLGVGKAADAEASLAQARSGNVPATSLQLLVARVATKKGDTAAALVARRAAAAADPSDLVARRALRGVTEE